MACSPQSQQKPQTPDFNPRAHFAMIDTMPLFLSVPLSQTPHLDSLVFYATPICAGHLPNESHNKRTIFIQIFSGHNDLPYPHPRPRVLQLLRLLEMQGDQRGMRSKGFVTWNQSSWSLLPLIQPADPTPQRLPYLALPGHPSLIPRAEHLQMRVEFGCPHLGLTSLGLILQLLKNWRVEARLTQEGAHLQQRTGSLQGSTVDPKQSS
ncbi:hypothetical protein mRhiFer1_008026 [Rhinolophus ferrumequinum]|uniref:Uncharacterized protein n=1 Tax=Rhinolophus ferrumequinum TaxID=59479 RepID=A0A7J7WR44_RHIFE|nr:hypothetical protein mRhiFer1_008026 [Rhinolophus ferrumequinum]